MCVRSTQMDYEDIYMVDDDGVSWPSIYQRFRNCNRNVLRWSINFESESELFVHAEGNFVRNSTTIKTQHILDYNISNNTPEHIVAASFCCFLSFSWKLIHILFIYLC